MPPESRTGVVRLPATKKHKYLLWIHFSKLARILLYYCQLFRVRRAALGH
jgi:hypothetical protein